MADSMPPPGPLHPAASPLLDPAAEAPALALPLEWLPAGGPPAQLIVLLHGWASDGGAMAPLAQALRAQFPQAALLAPDGWDASDGERPGRQWYGVDDLSPQNWPERVDAGVARLVPWVRAQQRRLGVGTAATALAGFSQGAVLALALALAEDGLAGRVLAFGGCLTRVPEAAPALTTVHLFHGGDDEVIPAEGARQAFRVLGDLQGDATLDVARGVGHVLHPALIDCALHRLQSHIPARTWREALGAAPSPGRH
jgi:phospholipase/carboxylesterase